MVGTAIAILWWLVGVVVVCAVIYVVFYVLRAVGLVIPTMVENFVWLIVGLIVFIYLIMAVTGQGGPSPFRFGAKSELPISGPRLAAGPEATGRYL